MVGLPGPHVSLLCGLSISPTHQQIHLSGGPTGLQGQCTMLIAFQSSLIFPNQFRPSKLGPDPATTTNGSTACCSPVPPMWPSFPSSRSPALPYIDGIRGHIQTILEKINVIMTLGGEGVQDHVVSSPDHSSRIAKV